MMKPLFLTTLGLLSSLSTFSYAFAPIALSKNESIYTTFYQAKGKGPTHEKDGPEQAYFEETTPINPNVQLDISGGNPAPAEGWKYPWNIIIHWTNPETGLKEEYQCTDQLKIQDGKIVQNAAYVMGAIWSESFNSQAAVQLDVSKQPDQQDALIKYTKNGISLGVLVPTFMPYGIPTCHVSFPNPTESPYKSYYQAEKGPINIKGNPTSNFIETTPINSNVKLNIKGEQETLDIGYDIMAWLITAQVKDPVSSETKEYRCKDIGDVHDNNIPIINTAAAILSRMWNISYTAHTPLELDVSNIADNAVSIDFKWQQPNKYCVISMPKTTQDGTIPVCSARSCNFAQ